MTSWSDLRKKWMEDPKFRKAYEELQPEHAIIYAIIR